MLSLLLAASSATTTPILSVAPAKSALADGAKIGSRRAGLACFPNGELRWSEAYLKGAPASIRAALVRAGIPQPDESGLGFGVAPASTPLIVQATISSARLSLCFTKSGFGFVDQDRVKGDGALGVDWAVYDRAAQKVVFTLHTDYTAPDKIESQNGPAGVVEVLLAGDAALLTANPDFKALLAETR